MKHFFSILVLLISFLLFPTTVHAACDNPSIVITPQGSTNTTATSFSAEITMQNCTATNVELRMDKKDASGNQQANNHQAKLTKEGDLYKSAAFTIPRTGTWEIYGVYIFDPLPGKPNGEARRFSTPVSMPILSPPGATPTPTPPSGNPGTCKWKAGDPGALGTDNCNKGFTPGMDATLAIQGCQCFPIGATGVIAPATYTTAAKTPIPTPPPLPPPCEEWAILNSEGKVIDRFSNKDHPALKNEKIRKKCAKVRTAIGVIDADPADAIKNLFGILLGISGGIALLLIIVSGFNLMTSQGDAEKIKGARETITSAIVGLLFMIFSIVLLQIIGVDILRIPGFTK